MDDEECWSSCPGVTGEFGGRAPQSRVGEEHVRFRMSSEIDAYYSTSIGHTALLTGDLT